MGAIAVLFLFVIMMLNVKQIEYKTQLSRFLPLNLYILFIFMYECVNANYLIEGGRSVFSITDYFLFNIAPNYVPFCLENFFSVTLLESDLYNLSFLLYSHFGLYVLLCSLLLLLGMVGAISLTLNVLVIVKKQDLYAQLEREYLIVQRKF